jgi:hypothetical protein
MVHSIKFVCLFISDKRICLNLRHRHGPSEKMEKRFAKMQEAKPALQIRLQSLQGFAGRFPYTQGIADLNPIMQENNKN